MNDPDEQNKKSQIEKFRDAAQELKTDQSEEAFDRALKEIAKAPPPHGDKPKRGSD